MTTSGCEDAGICEGFGCESGGGGGVDVGWEGGDGGFDIGGDGGDGGFDNAGGDGVGVWTGVPRSAGVCCELWSEEMSSSGGVVGSW